MSTLATVLADPSTSVQAEGIFNMVEVKSTEALATIRVVGVVIGVVAFLMIAGKARFSVGGTIMGIFLGGLIIWGVFGVEKVKNSVDEEMGDGTTGEVSAPALHELAPIDLTQPIQLRPASTRNGEVSNGG